MTFAVVIDVLLHFFRAICIGLVPSRWPALIKIGSEGTLRQLVWCPFIPSPSRPAAPMIKATPALLITGLLWYGSSNNWLLSLPNRSQWILFTSEIFFRLENMNSTDLTDNYKIRDIIPVDKIACINCSRSVIHIEYHQIWDRNITWLFWYIVLDILFDNLYHSTLKDKNRINWIMYITSSQKMLLFLFIKLR